MPMWIINWIREKLTQNLEYSMKEKLPKKIYIIVMLHLIKVR